MFYNNKIEMTMSAVEAGRVRWRPCDCSDRSTRRHAICPYARPHHRARQRAGRHGNCPPPRQNGRRGQPRRDRVVKL